MTYSFIRFAARLLALAIGLGALPAWAGQVDPALLAEARQSGPIPVLLVAPEQGVPALAPLRADADVLTRRVALVATLQARADASQALLRDWLDRRGIAHRDYWIANVIATRLDAAQIQALARRGDVARIVSDRAFPVRLPVPEAGVNRPRGSDATLAVPWGLGKINAPAAWAAGVEGQGVVVAGEDTGYQWNHPALKAQYRGWDGTDADHDYNWHDAVHVTGSSCGADSPFPCDDDSHGTHTMGTMIGTKPGGDRIGVAPAARWVGCRNMNAGAGTPARYIECMQWMLAPTDLAGNNPDPALAPDIINNSWACDQGEGCQTGHELDQAIANLIEGGIFYVASAGNEGPACFSIDFAPATYAPTFSVAATNSSDALAWFSSRGPIDAGASMGPGPSVTLDIAAPGVNVYSSVPGGGYGTMDGTSMAGPHVAGVAALVMSVNPALRGHPAQVAAILRSTAARQGITDPDNNGCGGLTMADWPNWQAGYGRLDAWAAVRLGGTLFRDGFEGA